MGDEYRQDDKVKARPLLLDGLAVLRIMTKSKPKRVFSLVLWSYLKNGREKVRTNKELRENSHKSSIDKLDDKEVK